MIYSIQYLYFSFLVLTCITSESVPPMSGFYTDDLDQTLSKIEIVYPEKVSKDGSFVSYYLPHYYNLESLESRPRRTLDGFKDTNSDDAIHFFVPIEGEKHQLELWPNLNFLAPGLVIERRDARDVENVNKAKISQISQKQCHYNGRIVGMPDSRAALSTCYGLAGYIQLPAGEEYLIEPVKDSKPAFNQEHPHFMYKRSGMKDRQGNTNCLTKGTAKEALAERLQWESVFGSQVREEFSPVNMNDLVRENTAKMTQDSLRIMKPVMDSQPAVSIPREVTFKDKEIELDKEKSNSINIPQSSDLKNENVFKVNVPPINPYHYDFSPFEKQGQLKAEYGNKLKQKALREELGSIKLPDANVSPLKQPANQPIDTEHFINKPIVSHHEKDKRIYEPDVEFSRVKRELNEKHLNFNPNSNKDLDIKSNEVYQQVPSKNYLKEKQNSEEAKVNTFGEISNHYNPQYFEKPNAKGAEFEIGIKSKESSKLKRDTQNSKDMFLTGTKITENSNEKINKDKQGQEYNTNKISERDNDKEVKNEVITSLLNNNINADINNNKAKDIKQNDLLNNPINEQMLNTVLENNLNQKYSSTNIENNLKRDIHLDTSEKSWQSEKNHKNLNTCSKSDKINKKETYNADIKGKYVDDSSERDKKKESKLSKVSKVQKSNTDNDDKIMVSALESVVRDMDKTKVKKDVLGGFAHTESKNLKIQPLYAKAPVDYNDEKYIKQGQTPEESPKQVDGKDENTRTFESNSQIGPGIVKESMHASDAIREPIQSPKAYSEKQSQNHVDEIIIRIKTPEGTISEVKQNYDTDSEGLRNNNIESVMINGNIGTKDSVFGNDQPKPSLTHIKTKDLEKIKRGVDSKSDKEAEEKSNNQDILKNSGGYSAQDFSIIVEAPQQFNEENNGPTKNKSKRDDNTIHLVIETEPEVKSPEGRNSESPGSNLFCQGKNCLEIKPVFLNDTKAALTSTNNTSGESTKEKVVEKRDAEDDETCYSTTTETPLNCQDFYNKVFNLELMITVDYKVVKMHEDDDIENFILTIINMVSSNFADKSIGFNLNVVLVRLILLTTCIKELDSDRFEPEELLENFCTWQVLVNPGRDDHPHHHDLAIFVSKMDKCAGKVMGVSYMTSVCRPDKACIICIDEGLLLANTITHQIGHSLGADHDDGQSSGCAPKLPDGTTYHMSPTISETSSAWSVCSKDAIIQFVQTQGSWCLIDTPLIRSYNFPLILPGQIYSAPQQCKLNFHMTAIPCLVGSFCNKLYCQITDKLCATKGDPPADGTFCASNMWCFHKQCVHIGRRPGAINGEWGPWAEWSICTRTCGGGVSNSYRICNNPKPENGGRFCIGDRMRFRICQTQPCQGFTESFRDLQCKQTEDRPFRGKIHNWVQYQSLFINIECALVCQNRRGDVVMRSPIVADGTPCKAGTQNVCIQGICRSVGCDYVIDSTAKEDACGVCHGNGTECRIVQGVFDEAITKKGLIEFLRIPKDSGMIFIREISPSANVIVVSGAINRAFYLNGLGEHHWSMTGDVSFGLTHGVYEKRGGMERVFIRGPTKEDLVFYIHFRERNKGVHYQYATLEYDPTYIPRYQWQYLDWDACTDPCSGGSQRAHAKCVEDRGGVVDDKYCLESSRPIDIIRPCNDFPCQAKWWVSVWSDCICTGTTSVMFRSVLCMRANDESGTRVEVVKESECTVSKKPPTQKPCNATDEENECAKRSIADDYLFHQHRDLRRAISPRLGFSAFSPVDSEGSVSEETQSLSEQSFDDPNKESFNENKNLKKPSKPQSNKNVNVKESISKFTKPKVVVKDQLDKKKVSTGKLQEIDNFKPIELGKNEGSEEHKPYMNNADMLLGQNKGRQIAKLTQKNSGSLSGPLKSAISKLTGDNTNDIDTKSAEEKGVSDNSDACIQTSAECPKEETTETTFTTCKQTCAIEPHKKTTCCRTTEFRQLEPIRTTFETTTIRPVSVKLDELNIDEFGLTIVPLDVPGRRKLLPQSDPEFINLGALGQFGVGDELNSTEVAGQEALDLLEFARSNASEEPNIVHEDNVHN